MAKMASSTLLSFSDLVNTPVKKTTKSLVRVLFVVALITPDEALELGEKLFDRV